MKSRAILGLLALYSALCIPQSAFAVMPTPSPTPTATATAHAAIQSPQFYNARTNDIATLRVTDNGDGTYTLETNASGGGGGGGGDASAANQSTQITAEQAMQTAIGAKTDAKNTATDTTSVGIISLLKQISASAQAPPAQAISGAVPAGANLIGKVGIDQTTPGTTNAVAITGSQITITVATVTTDGNVAAGKHHIEFILSSDFAGTMDGEPISGATLAIYNPGDAPLGSTFAQLDYEISAGNAVLTTW